MSKASDHNIRTKPTSDIAELWKHALAAYRAATGIDIQTTNIRSAADVLCFAEEKALEFSGWRNDGRKLAKFRDAVKKTLDPIEQLGGFVSGVASNAFQPAGTIFGALTLLISAANKVSANFDLIESFFSKVGMFLDRMAVLEEYVSTTPEARRVIIEILTSILVISGLSQKAISKSRTKIFLKAAIGGGVDEELGAAYQQLEDSIIQQCRLLTTENFVDGKKTRESVQRTENGMTQTYAALNRLERKLSVGLSELRMEGKTERKDKMETAEQASRIARRFPPIDNVLGEHWKRSKQPLKGSGSGDWLLHDDLFRAFTNFSSSSPCLYILGAPGVGKSILSTIAINHLREIYKSNTRTTVAYSIFHQDKEESRSFKHAMYTLFAQISTSNPKFAELLADMTEVGEVKTDTVETLWENILCRHFNTDAQDQLFIVLDGLDEAEKSERVEFLRLLGDISDNRIRILMFGRPEVEFELKMEMAAPPPIVKVNAVKTTPDLIKYINFHWERYSRVLPKRGAGVKDKVLKALIENSNGMFLWVVLVFDEIKRQTQVTSVLEVLKRLPRDLSGLYDKFFERLRPNLTDGKPDILKSLLAWVVYSERPRSLLELDHYLRVVVDDAEFSIIQEIKLLYPSLFSLGTKDGRGVEESDATPLADYVQVFPESTEDNEDEMEINIQEIDDICQHLYDESRFVQLRHASLREYLLEAHVHHNDFIPSSAEAQLILVIDCLSVLEKLSYCYDVVKLNTANQDGDMHDPRYEYAGLFWLRHLEASTNILDKIGLAEHQERIGSLADALVRFIANENALQRYVEFLLTFRLVGDSLSYEPTVTGLSPGGVVEKFFHLAQDLTTQVHKNTGTWITDSLSNPFKSVTILAKAAFSHWIEYPVLDVSQCDLAEEPAIQRFNFALVCFTAAELFPRSYSEKNLSSMALDEAVDLLLSRAELVFKLSLTPTSYFNIWLHKSFSSRPTSTSYFDIWLQNSEFATLFASRNDDRFSLLRLQIGPILREIAYVHPFFRKGYLIESAIRNRDADEIWLLLTLFEEAIVLQPTYFTGITYAIIFDLYIFRNERPRAIQLGLAYLASGPRDHWDYFVRELAQLMQIEERFDELKAFLECKGDFARHLAYLERYLGDFRRQVSVNKWLAAVGIGSPYVFLKRCYKEMIVSQRYKGTSAFYRWLLADLYEEMGEFEKAFEQYHASFFLDDLCSAKLTTFQQKWQGTQACLQFATSLASMAGKRQGAEQDLIINLMKRMINIDYGQFCGGSDGKTDETFVITIRFKLGRVLWDIGRKGDGMLVFNGIFKFFGALLEVRGRKSEGFHGLALLMAHVGLSEDAAIAYTLYFSDIDIGSPVNEVADENDKVQNHTAENDNDARAILATPGVRVDGGKSEEIRAFGPVCCFPHCRSRLKSYLRQDSWDDGAKYLCLTCEPCIPWDNVFTLCAWCYFLFIMKGLGLEAESYDGWKIPCDNSHVFLKGPVDDWGGVKNGVMTIGERKVQVKDWLSSVERKWKAVEVG